MSISIAYYKAEIEKTTTTTTATTQSRDTPNEIEKQKLNSKTTKMMWPLEMV